MQSEGKQIFRPIECPVIVRSRWTLQRDYDSSLRSITSGQGARRHALRNGGREQGRRFHTEDTECRDGGRIPRGARGTSG